MTNLTLINIETGLHFSFKLENIQNLKIGKAKDWFSKSDCDGNGIKLNDEMLRINFKNGEKSSFGKEWIYTFE